MTDLVFSPAAKRNMEGMKQLLLATAADFLLEYKFSGILKHTYHDLLAAHMIFENVINNNVDPNDSDAVLNQCLAASTYHVICYIFLSDDPIIFL